MNSIVVDSLSSYLSPFVLDCAPNYSGGPTEIGARRHSRGKRPDHGNCSRACESIPL